MDERMLRECKNDVKVVGYVLDNTLKKSQDRNGSDIISGNIKVGTDENNSVNVSYYCPRYSKKNPTKESIFYTQIEKLCMDNTVSYNKIKEMDPNASEQSIRMRCSLVSLFGNVDENIYLGKEGDLVIAQRVRGRGGRLCPTENFNPGINFEVEGYLSQMKDEVVDGEPTGRLNVTLLSPAYDGVSHQINLIAPAGGIADYISTNYTKGDTVTFKGFIKTQVTKIKRVEAFNGFNGTEEPKYSTNFVTEYIITNGPLAENIIHQGDEGSLSTESITLAEVKREERINAAKNPPAKASAPAPSSNKPFGFSTSASTPAKSSASDFDFGSIPF